MIWPMKKRKTMISKQEYIFLYCDEALYKETGIIALNVDKLDKRMNIDPLKTVRDLDDYGFSDAMRDTPLGPISEVRVLNVRDGRMRSIPVDSDHDAIAAALAAGRPQESPTDFLIEVSGYEDDGLLD